MTARRQAFEIETHDQWQALRAHDLTASRIAAIFDAHPHLTRAQLAADLRAGTEQRKETPVMRAGRENERAVAIAVARARPQWRILPAASYHRLSPLRLGATPDLWLDNDGVVEIKTTTRRRLVHFQLQLATQMLVIGLTRGVLAVSTRRKVYLHTMEADGALEWAIADAVEAWWSVFDTGALPPAAPMPPLPAMSVSEVTPPRPVQPGDYVEAMLHNMRVEQARERAA